MIELMREAWRLAAPTIPLIVDTVRAIRQGNGDLAARRAREAAEREAGIALAKRMLEKHKGG